MISRSSPRYSIIKLRALLTFYIYYNKFFKICQICIKTHNTKKKQTKRSRCKKKMLEEFFLFLIHFQNILEPMSTCSLIDDIFEFGGLKMKVENKMRISDSGLYTERNNNSNRSSWLRGLDSNQRSSTYEDDEMDHFSTPQYVRGSTKCGDRTFLLFLLW